MPIIPHRTGKYTEKGENYFGMNERNPIIAIFLIFLVLLIPLILPVRRLPLMFL